MSALPFISSPTIPVHIPSGVPLALPMKIKKIMLLFEITYELITCNSQG